MPDVLQKVPKGKGRPRRRQNWRHVGTTLPPSAVTQLRKLGRGNVNHGILNVLEFYVRFQHLLSFYEKYKHLDKVA